MPGKSNGTKKTSTVKKPIKYREVPALNNKFNASDYSIILERKDRASLAWDFFGRLFNKEEKRYIDEVNVYCTLCLQNLITRQQSNALELPSASLGSVKKYKSTTSTSSLLLHLSSSHGKDEKEADENKLTQYFGKTSEANVTLPSIAFKHSLLARRLVLLCARSLISYESVTSEGFSDFFKSYGIVADLDVPHRTTLTRTALEDVYRDSIPLVKGVIRSSSYCSLTFDIWTDNYRRKSYVTFNYSCIDDSCRIQNLNLCTLLMPYRHRAVEILEEFDKTLKFYEIDRSEICTVTDKGSNLVKLINDAKLKHHFCLGHGFHNLINEDGFSSVPDIDELLTKIKNISYDRPLSLFAISFSDFLHHTRIMLCSMNC
ncbi:hypothetical protein Bhyg_03865 [Pseudolycoriella hygida]|uniref:Uncharacterized protein n=1 Tax=Pseudolycoriella hygida TaxID=35572 RepID=A0A9Q0RWJ7_9DIPT|nr:hypothetical protein Bhyg_13679 [Pseudolycoriella hygida]KAJ6648634.1 hypothetical protein Bhyg_03865 [Pseudolycoriella hygida]